MFDSFRRAYTEDPADFRAVSVAIDGSAVASSNALLDQLGGRSFGGGVYRVVRATDLDVWNGRIAIAFPEFAGRTSCFGYDWLGRVFAVDPARLEEGEPGVVMFEPGTGEALEIPCGIEAFHEEELIEYADAALAVEFHKQWLESGGSAPRYEQCIGYKKPLFLGGTDGIDNLEVSDLDVYWHLMGQLIAYAKGAAPGTPTVIGRV